MHEVQSQVAGSSGLGFIPDLSMNYIGNNFDIMDLSAGGLSSTALGDPLLDSSSGVGGQYSQNNAFQQS